jgi:uncharacterized protein (DUF1810 family)
MTGSFDLERFVRAQDPVWPAVLSELRAGAKRTHWMWFVFPQLAGLGRSATAREFGLGSLAEARAYLAHPVLGARLRQCAALVLAHPDIALDAMFGYPDNLKFHSSMTLFALADPDERVFAACLDHFFAGARDRATLQLLEHLD